jgi:hypothetical protein
MTERFPSNYPDFAVYLHLPLTMPDGLILKYLLTDSVEVPNYSINEFLIEEQVKNPLN